MRKLKKMLKKGKGKKGEQGENIDASIVIDRKHTESKPPSIFSPDNNNKDFFGRPHGSTNLEKNEKETVVSSTLINKVDTKNLNQINW